METIQMLWSLGEFVGAIAVVATLIYLAIQLRQNTTSVKASAFQAWLGAINGPLAAVHQNDSVALAVSEGSSY